jgi:hypothetical protein
LTLLFALKMASTCIPRWAAASALSPLSPEAGERGAGAPNRQKLFAHPEAAGGGELRLGIGVCRLGDIFTEDDFGTHKAKAR